MKCEHCKKKCVVLVTCKCEKNYCLKHRLPETHLCTYIFDKVELEKIPEKKLETI